MPRLAAILPLLDGSREPEGWATRLGIALLRPPGALYAGVQALRASLYHSALLPSWRAPVPVIAVGNLASGGTGKTPMTLRLGQHLLAKGIRLAVASRGYGQTSRQAVTVVSAPDGVRLRPPMAADEAVLAAERLPGAAVLTGPRRRALAEHALHAFDVQAIVLDDAFQHLAMQRDLNLLLLDARHPLGNGRVLPAGLLREAPAAMGRADLVILTRADDPEAVARSRALLAPMLPGCPILAATHRPVRWRPMAGGPPLPLSALAGTPLFALSGIARPEGFFRGVTDLGLTLSGCRGFGDHHYWSEAEVRALEQEARDSGAEAAVCTEKDGVKLVGRWQGPPLYALEIEMSFVAGEELLWQAVDALFPALPP